MNRIMLIGNGFDLAHGLKTSYNNFLENYWLEWLAKLSNCDDCQISDEFYHFAAKYKDGLCKVLSLRVELSRFSMAWSMSRTREQIDSEAFTPKSLKDFSELLDAINHDLEQNGFSEQLYCQPINKLFDEINNICLTKWVDIENEYYRVLKSHLTASDRSELVKKLNYEFGQIKELLEEYLSKVCAQDVEPNESIESAITQPLKNREIAASKRELLIREIYADTLFRANYPDVLVKRYVKESNKHLDGITPKRTLLLNFNYTDTAKRLYGKPEYEIINIHGELNNKNNPVIFGYGDELDEDHKTIVNINDNDCMENIKSTRYLQTDNYRRLLDFISSEPFQICIMGHSCGNSDRTLLNTLFEHKNCISVKPYYYIKEDGTDNYIELVQNIYRNFKDMALMRDIVVNKDYCEPMY